MSDSLTLREATPADAEAVREVNEKAFDGPGEARLVAALERRGAVTLSLVACRDQLVVAHLLLSPVTIESPPTNHPALGLGSMAVRPQHQNQGIGSELVREALEIIRERGHRRAVLLGHPAFYPRFSFQTANPLGILCEFEAPEEAFIALELQPGAWDGISGVVRYQPEFSGPKD